MNWHLNRIQYPIYNLGPGKRIGIWTQGCSLACKGCISQTTWNKKGGTDISVLNLFNQICKIQSGYQGITITGGEPFEQYESLITFLYLIKTKTNLDIYCFSGYYLEELLKQFPDKLFCRYIDYLIDGRYIQIRTGENGLTGSENQNLYKFVNGVPILENSFQENKKWSVKITETGRVYMAGIPKTGEMQYLKTNLERHQINKQFK